MHNSSSLADYLAFLKSLKSLTVIVDRDRSWASLCTLTSPMFVVHLDEVMKTEQVPDLRNH